MDALTYLGPSGAAVVVVWLFLRYLVPAINKLSTSIDKNTAVTTETFKFLVNLNGDFKKVVKKKLGK